MSTDFEAHPLREDSYVDVDTHREQLLQKKPTKLVCFPEDLEKAKALLKTYRLEIKELP